MIIVLSIVLATFGALLGSFGCAQVWRLRAHQVVEDKKDYEKLLKRGDKVKQSDFYDSKELAQLKPLIRPVVTDRSQCLSCVHQLAWYDLIPVVSWLALRGKCRYCGEPIGKAEFLAEIGLAATFVISFLAWPHSIDSFIGISIFVLWLLACLVMLVLFIYDAKWSLLPLSVNIVFIGLAAIFAGLMVAFYGWSIMSLLGSIAILSGLYALFAIFGWAGFGDAILGLGLSLLVGEWQIAFLAVFLANLFGSLMLIPLAIRRKLKRRMKMPFGPYLIIGAVIAVFWGYQIIDWYLSTANLFFDTLML
ncbi:MAG: prepilin peptidase [Candidatus Saccharimonas sp.]